MKRLTKYLASGAADYNYPADCYGGNDCNDRAAKSAYRQTCVERLADYEDTGLTPGEVRSLWGEWNAMMRVLNSIGSYDRLRELAEADEDGRVVVLPVKPVLTPTISSMLYIIEDGEIYEDSLYEGIVGMSGRGEMNVIYGTIDALSFEQNDIGKTVFLTSEEAKKALEAMKNE